MFDETEALIAIDVNTGRNKGSKDMDKTILQTNLEAADEIARQMRLRNVGGLIIGDFIDMKSRKDQQQVYDRMKERLKRDKSKTHVLPLSSMGLMEMTRQRAQESLSSSVYVSCPYCSGRGKVKSAMSMSVELQRTLNALMRKHQDTIHELKITVHPEVLQRLRTRGRGPARRDGAPLRRPADFPRRRGFSPREIHDPRRRHRQRTETLTRPSPPMSSLSRDRSQPWVGPRICASTHRARRHGGIACCREPDKAGELKAIGGERLSIHALDVSDPKAIAALPGQLASNGVAVDVLINNAGVAAGRGGAFGEFDAATMANVLRVNSVALRCW